MLVGIELPSHAGEDDEVRVSIPVHMLVPGHVVELRANQTLRTYLGHDDLDEGRTLGHGDRATVRAIRTLPIDRTNRRRCELELDAGSGGHASPDVDNGYRMVTVVGTEADHLAACRLIACYRALRTVFRYDDPRSEDTPRRPAGWATFREGSTILLESSQELPHGATAPQLAATASSMLRNEGSTAIGTPTGDFSVSSLAGVYPNSGSYLVWLGKRTVVFVHDSSDQLLAGFEGRGRRDADVDQLDVACVLRFDGWLCAPDFGKPSPSADGVTVGERQPTAHTLDAANEAMVGLNEAMVGLIADREAVWATRSQYSGASQPPPRPPVPRAPSTRAAMPAGSLGQRPRWLIPVIACGALALVAMVVGALAEGDKDQDESFMSRLAEATAWHGVGPDDHVLSIGETGKTGDLEVTVLSVEDPWESATGLYEPDAGRRLVAVELSITNTGTEPAAFFPVVRMRVADTSNQPWDVGVLHVHDRAHVDAVIPAGATHTGWTLLSVGDDARGLLIKVTAAFPADGVVFALE